MDIDRALAAGQPFLVEYRLRGADGAYRWVWEKGVAVDFPEGRRLEGFIMDVTERKHLEESIVRAQRLENLGRLSAGVAHDLNNILTPILLASSMLRDTSQAASARLKYLDIIDKSSKRAHAIVNQMLAFSRDMGHRKEVVSIRENLTELVDVLNEVFPDDVSLKTRFADPDLCVLGDAGRLHQVFLNLCVNARDAMPDGGLIQLEMDQQTLNAEALIEHSHCQAGSYVRVVVRDTGPGIPESERANIFEPFYTTKEVGKGTGLELYTVLTIVKDSGGFVVCGDNEPRGTVFQIYLPACAHDAAAVEASPPVSGKDGEGRSVMIGDGERLIRDTLESALLSHGYRVLAADNGIEALWHYHRGELALDVVITEREMSGMDGLELARALRADGFDGVMLLIADGEADADLAARARELGILKTLSKPVGCEALLAALRASLQLPQPGAARSYPGAVVKVWLMPNPARSAPASDLRHCSRFPLLPQHKELSATLGQVLVPVYRRIRGGRSGGWDPDARAGL